MFLKSMFVMGNKLSTGLYNRKIFNVSLRSINQGITFTSEHDQMKNSLQKIINNDINPFVDEWEEKEIYPAHQIFKKLGQAGLLGITKPVAYGGLGLDVSFSLAFYEGLAQINCGGIPMSIVVHTDCSTPALTSFGSDKLKQEFLVPSIAGERVSCIGVSEPDHGSDVAGANGCKKILLYGYARFAKQHMEIPVYDVMDASNSFTSNVQKQL